MNIEKYFKRDCYASLKLLKTHNIGSSDVRFFHTQRLCTRLKYSILAFVSEGCMSVISIKVYIEEYCRRNKKNKYTTVFIAILIIVSLNIIVRR